MSYCLTASCLAHKREVFWQHPWRMWVHAAGLEPCDALAGQRDPTELPCRYCGQRTEIDGTGRLWTYVPDAPGHWAELDMPGSPLHGRPVWRDDKWTRDCPLSPTYGHESSRPWP